MESTVENAEFDITDWAWRPASFSQDDENEQLESHVPGHPTDQASTISPTEAIDSPSSSITNIYEVGSRRTSNNWQDDGSDTNFTVEVTVAKNSENPPPPLNNTKSQQPWLSTNRDNIQFLAGAAISGGLMWLGGVPACVMGLAGYTVVQLGKYIYNRNSDSNRYIQAPAEKAKQD